jgi:hypothetical protein
MSRLDAELKAALEGFPEDWTMDCKYSHSKGPHDDSQNGNTQQPTWHGVFFFGEIFATWWERQNKKKVWKVYIYKYINKVFLIKKNWAQVTTLWEEKI